MPDVILIRPGSTDFDEQDRIQGELNLPLNEHGREQIGKLFEQLRSLHIETILTAPSEPSRSTAETISDEIGAPLKEVEGLRNLNQGLWQGLTTEAVRRKYPKVAKQWQESPETICPPEGEAVSEALERIQKVLHKAMKRKGDIALVASEPLATLIACVIRNDKPVLPVSITGAENTSTIEVLKMNGEGNEKAASNSAGSSEGLQGESPTAVAAQGGLSE